MADQTTANIRIVLEDASEGGAADSHGTGTPHRAGKATEEATKRPADQSDVSKAVADVRKHHESTVTENLKKNLKSTGRDWAQLGRAARGMLRGTAFAQHGTMASAGVAAGEFGQAGSSLAGFMSRGGGIGAALGTLGAVAGAAAAAVGMFAMVVKTSSDAMAAMAERHRAYSSDVAIAFAEKSVARIMFEIGQAQKYGEQEARNLKARGDLGIEWSRAMDELASRFSLMAIPILENLTEVMKKINKWFGLQDEKHGKDMDEMKMLGRAISAIEQMVGSGHPGEAWMKNTPHLQLKDAQVGIEGFDNLEEQRVGNLDPFAGAM